MNRPFPLPIDEDQRLRRLAEYQIYGTPPEEFYDQVAGFAAALCDAPAALLSVIGAERQWVKARDGLDVQEFGRELSFCAHALVADDILIVPDACEDPRFSDNPFVTGDPHVRFYAGAPLVSYDGHRLGSLCVLDWTPRQEFSAAQRGMLRRLATLVSSRLEQRRIERVGHVALKFANSTSYAVLAVDGDGRITFWNRSAERLFGYKQSHIMGRDMRQLAPLRLRAAYARGLARLAGRAPLDGGGKTLEMTAMRRDGTEFPVELSVSSWTGAQGIGIGAIIRDISERRRQEARLQHLARHDWLTGLANRLCFDESLTEALAKGAATVLVIDLDGFKEVNDTLGHGTGDSLLRELARRLPHFTEEDATVARLGGDEFGVLVPGRRDPLRAAAQAERLLELFAAPFEVGGHTLHLGGSIGAAVGPDHGETAEELAASADLALFKAKQEGGRRYRLFEFPMRDRMANHNALEDELRRAVARGELELHYQPQVRLRDRCIVGAEALLRWRHPERGLLMPAAFLAALESHAFAHEVGSWILDEACRQAAVWRGAGLQPIRMGVNLFGAQLRARTLAGVVEAVLGRHGLPATALELEITETVALRHDDEALAPLRGIHATGVGIAFDDFGTGFASLSTLKRFPLSRLKIDRGFVRDLHTDPHDKAIIQAVLAMAASLGLHVIAEGIERGDQEALLSAWGCDEGQGFLYGRALSAADFARLLAPGAGVLAA